MPLNSEQRTANSEQRTANSEQRLRAWLEYVAETAIDMLDAMDASHEDLEDDELGDDAGDRRIA